MSASEKRGIAEAVAELMDDAVRFAVAREYNAAMYPVIHAFANVEQAIKILHDAMLFLHSDDAMLVDMFETLTLIEEHLAFIEGRCVAMEGELPLIDTYAQRRLEHMKSSAARLNRQLTERFARTGRRVRATAVSPRG